MKRVRVGAVVLWRKITLFFLRQYVYMVAPWVHARFYAAWVMHQKDGIYRERLVMFGFEKAFMMFLGCKVSQRYMLQLRLEREPRLWWQLTFLPWTIPVPDDLLFQAVSGAFHGILGDIIEKS
jgi:hypothetical protein